ncbi:MAG: response regulator [Anaerolineae bacterium]
MAYRILLVDDDPILLKTLGLAFHRAGYEVAVALDGPDALRKAEEKPPDLIILDIMLPGIDGFEVCRRLRQMPDIEHVPIIMLSALGRVEDKLTGFSAGADDYLVKPVMPQEMLTRVQVLLARSARLMEVKRHAQSHIFAFIGVKGGVGTTTLAVNVALIAAQNSQRTILIDLHPEGGLAAVQLGQVPRATLEELIQHPADSINEGLLEKYLLPHRTGLRILPAPLVPRKTSNGLSLQHVHAILDQLTQQANRVIVDLPPLLSPMTWAALQRADRIALVTEADSIAIGAARRWLELMEAEGIVKSIIYVVAINRIGGTTPYTKLQLEEMLGCEVVALIAHAPEQCLLANKNGIPVALQKRDTVLEQQLRELAKALM